MADLDVTDPDFETFHEGMEDEEPEPEKPEILTFDQIMGAPGGNIAALLDPNVVQRIGHTCKQEYDIDLRSNNEWLEDNKKGLDLAMQVSKPKSYPWPHAANVIYPLIFVAASQFHSRAYPALVPDRNVVKGVVQGSDDGVKAPPAPAGPMMGGPAPQMMAPPGAGPAPASAADPSAAPSAGQDMTVAAPPAAAPAEQWITPPGAKAKKASRVARYMSWQLLEDQKNWEDETDTMLLYLPIAGTAFRKNWHDGRSGSNASLFIPGDRLIVNAQTRATSDAPRISEKFDLLPHQVSEHQRLGLWLWDDKTWTLDAIRGGNAETDESPEDDDSPINFIEQHRRLDLDGDGYPEPYIVQFVEGSGLVVRIERAFDNEDVTFASGANGPIIAKIDPIPVYQKYSFIPNPKGGFYSIGFGWLLGPINRTINSAINQMMDAGTLQNLGGGFLGRGLRLPSGEMRFRPGEYKQVETNGLSLRENVVPLQQNGPSQTMFSLLGLLLEAGQDISATQDINLGKMDKNVAPTTALTLVEQGSKQFTAIFKRLHRCFKGELRLQYRLNARYLNETKYFTLLDEPEFAKADDFDMESVDVSPVSDPAMVTDAVRMAKANAALALVGQPGVNALKVLRYYVSALGIGDASEFVMNEMPADPKIEIDKGRLENDRQRVQATVEETLAKIRELETRSVLNLSRADNEEARTGIEELKVTLEEGRKRLEAMIDVKERDMDRLERASGDSGVSQKAE